VSNRIWGLDQGRSAAIDIFWLSVILLPFLAAFFGTALLAALERSWRFATVSLVSVAAALTAVILTGHHLLPVG
jgi:hypothetical protein